MNGNTGNVTILAAEVLPKTAKDYKFVEEGRPGNPTLHPKNYAINEVFRLDFDTFQRISAHDEEALEEIREKLRKKNLKGTFILQKVLGGPGRRGRWESKSTWRAKRQAGMPEIARITVD